MNSGGNRTKLGRFKQRGGSVQQCTTCNNQYDAFQPGECIYHAGEYKHMPKCSCLCHKKGSSSKPVKAKLKPGNSSSSGNKVGATTTIDINDTKSSKSDSKEAPISVATTTSSSGSEPRTHRQVEFASSSSSSPPAASAAIRRGVSLDSVRGLDDDEEDNNNNGNGSDNDTPPSAPVAVRSNSGASSNSNTRTTTSATTTTSSSSSTATATTTGSRGRTRSGSGAERSDGGDEQPSNDNGCAYGNCWYQWTCCHTEEADAVGCRSATVHTPATNIHLTGIDRFRERS
jgi:hypothetical protein